MRLLLGPIALLAVHAGCVRFADIRPETRPVAPESELGAVVEGRACMFSLFHFIPFGKHPLVTARESALDAGAQQPLVDLVIEEDYIYAVVGDVRCATVRGRPASPATGTVSTIVPSSTAPAEPVQADPLPSASTTTIGDPEAAARGPQRVVFDDTASAALTIGVLKTWVGGNVTVVLRSGREATGRLVSVSNEKLEVSSPPGRSWSASFAVVSEVRREAAPEIAPSPPPPDRAVPPPLPTKPAPIGPTVLDLATAEGRELAAKALPTWIGLTVTIERRVGPPVAGELVQVGGNRLLVRTSDGVVQIGNAAKVTRGP